MSTSANNTPQFDTSSMLADLADSLDESVLFLSPEGIVLAANRAAAFWLGMQSRKSLIGSNVFEAIPEELVEHRRKLLDKVVSSGRQMSFEDETDARTYAHRLTPHFNEDRTIRYISVISTNITRLRHSDQKLRREQQRQIFFMESLPGFFYLCGKKGEINYSNRTFKRYFGRPQKRFCRDLAANAELESGLCPPEDIFLSGKPREWEWTNPEDDRTFHLHCHPMTDVDGAPMAAILGIDVTLRKQAEAQLLETQRGLEETVQRRTQELESANQSLKSEVEGHKRTEKALKQAMQKATVAVRAKASFLANMSHEIRTPMNAVIGMAELALHTTNEKRRQHFIEMVKEAGISLLTIINDILDYSKIEAQKLTLEKLHFDTRSVIASALQLHQLQAAAKGLWLRTAIDENVPQVLVGDPVRLKQVLTNLIGNALKFTHQGGIDVDIKALEPDGPVTESGPDAHVRFTVRDTGIGVPKEKQDAIFDSFSQVDASVTREFGGTGLGLTISRHLVQLMGGDIRLDSTPGAGSAFSFDVHLPLGDPGLVPDSEQEGQPFIRSVRPLNILLVEDNELNRELAHTVLEDTGHRVTDASNGLEALKLLAERDYDLVFMDIQMPGMDGMTATRAIREGKQGVRDRFVPIIAMTAHAMKGDRERFIRAGMNDYLSKPLDLDKLFKAIGKISNLSAAVSSAAETRNDTNETWRSATVPSSADPGEPQPPVANRKEALERLNGNEALLDKLYELFLSATPEEIDKLDRALIQGRHEDAAIHAHTLKGTSATIGADRFHALAKPMDEAAKAQDWEKLAVMLERLRQRYQEFMEHVSDNR